MSKGFLFKTVSLFGIAMVMQGCSWIHSLIIKNPTDLTWTIEYTVKDERGIFNDGYYYYWEDVEEKNLPTISDRKVQFIVAPNQSITIGKGFCANYKSYRKRHHFKSSLPWRTFINVDTISFSNEDVNVNFLASELSKVMSKNSNISAIINLKKVLKYSNSN